MNLFPVLFAAVLFAVIFALAVAFRPTTSADATIPVAVARHANRWRGAGLLAGLICAGPVAAFGLRPALMTGAPLFAICVLPAPASAPQPAPAPATEDAGTSTMPGLSPMYRNSDVARVPELDSLAISFSRTARFP